MPTFEYRATQPDGTPVNGVEFGTSLDQVVSKLAQRGLAIEHIGVATALGDPLAGGNGSPATRNGTAAVQTRPEFSSATAPAALRSETAGPTLGSVVAGPPTDPRSYAATSVWGPLVGQVPLKDLAFFFRQAGTMLNAGVPIVQSFATLSSQSKSPKLGGIIKEMSGQVEAGRPLTATMQRYPEVFGPVAVSVIRAGEEGGFLDRALTQVADYLDQELKLRNLYKRLTFFPKLQVVLSIIIILLANLIIGSLNASAGRLSSPLTTPSTWIWLGPLIVAVFLFFRVGLANPAIRHGWDTMISNLPGFGKLVRELAMARFGRAFGAMYRSGVPLGRSLQLSADACGNEYLRGRIYPAVPQLDSGAGVGDVLASTGAFSPIVLDMVRTGESTGNLDQMLEKTADFYEDEATTKSTQLAYVVGAVLGILVAIYIGYIVITFYMGYGSSVMSAGGQ